MFNPLNLISKFIKSGNQKELDRIGKIVRKINELEDKSIWLWNKRNGWRWTQKDVFPYLFRWRDSAWIYLHKNPSGGALYYNTASQTIEIED